MPNYEVTDEVFIEAMEKAVAQKGADYVYPATEFDEHGGVSNTDWRASLGECRYSLPDGTPACIIGQAIHLIDPKYTPEHDLIADAATVLDSVFPGLTPPLLAAATDAQVIQDSGYTWGDALDTFRREYARRMDDTY